MTELQVRVIWLVKLLACLTLLAVAAAAFATWRDLHDPFATFPAAWWVGLGLFATPYMVILVLMWRRQIPPAMGMASGWAIPAALISMVAAPKVKVVPSSGSEFVGYLVPAVARIGEKWRMLARIEET